MNGDVATLDASGMCAYEDVVTILLVLIGVLLFKRIVNEVSHGAVSLRYVIIAA